MSVILDVKFNDVAKQHATKNKPSQSLDDMAVHARMFGWNGFGMVGDGAGAPLQQWAHNKVYECDCVGIGVQVNTEAAHGMFFDAGVNSYDWFGYIVWDASNSDGYEVAKRIDDELRAQPVLDYERESQLIMENACAIVGDTLDVPTGVDPFDVVLGLPEIPGCWRCSPVNPDDADEAFRALAYVKCSGVCGDYIPTDTKLTERFCSECAQYEQDDGCFCITDYVKSPERRGEYGPTLDVIVELRSRCKCKEGSAAS